jgi:hypothetical protein
MAPVLWPSAIYCAGANYAALICAPNSAPPVLSNSRKVGRGAVATADAERTIASDLAPNLGGECIRPEPPKVSEVY